VNDTDLVYTKYAIDFEGPVRRLFNTCSELMKMEIPQNTIGTNLLYLLLLTRLSRLYGLRSSIPIL
jgi:hypothetical protein